MAEFKLQRGQKVYHIREFSSILELARRKLVAPEDPIYIPTIGRWVYANAIRELRPLLGEGQGAYDDAEELPLEFVEPLTEDLDGLTVEVDSDSLNIDIGFDETGSASESGQWSPATNGNPDFPLKVQSPPTSPNVWPDVPVEDWFSDIEELPPEDELAPLTDVASRRALRSDVGISFRASAGDSRVDGPAVPRQDAGYGYDSTLPEDAVYDSEDRLVVPYRGNGKAPASNVVGPAADEAHSPGIKPLSFQDWMVKQAQTGALEEGAGELLPLISVSANREPEVVASVNWFRMIGLIAFILFVFGGGLIWLKTTANLQFDPWKPETPKPSTVNVDPRGTATVDSTALDQATLALDLKLRTMIPPVVGAFYSFDQAQDRLFGELLNLKVGVADVKLTPIDGDRTRPVRRTDADITVRLKKSSVSTDEQTGLVGLGVGKYITRDKIQIRNLILQIEQPGQDALIRIVPGRASADYFAGVTNIQQFLLATQAGTIVP